MVIRGSRGTGKKTFCSSICYDKFFQIERGEFIATGARVPQPFDPYFDHAMRRHITSYREQEQAVSEHNKVYRDLPEDKKGKHRELSFANDNHKFIQECKYISKNKKEHVYQNYLSSNRDPRTLTSTHKRWFGIKEGTRKYIMGLLFLAIIQGCSFAEEPPQEHRLLGIPWVELEVGNKVYRVPVISPAVRQELYFIFLAIEGDQVARKMLLGSEKQKYFFIGDGETVRWLVMDKKGQWVVENGKETYDK